MPRQRVTRSQTPDYLEIRDVFPLAVPLLTLWTIGRWVVQRVQHRSGSHRAV